MTFLFRTALCALLVALACLPAAAQTPPAARAKPAPGVPIAGHPAFGPWQFSMQVVDGQDYRQLAIPSGEPAACLAECARDARCAAATFTMPANQGAPQPVCWLKALPGRLVPHPGAMSAIKVASPPPPTFPSAAADLSGPWSGPLGTYDITQSGNSFTWRVGSEVGHGTISGDVLQATWTGGGSATGRVVERTPNGSPMVIAWSNGAVFRRMGMPAPTIVTPPPPPPPVAPVPTPPTPPTPPAPPSSLTSNLSGQWSGPLGIYEFTQSGNNFTWRVGNEIGQGTISGENLQVTWTGGGFATGRITERTAQGLPTVIGWSNGAVFRRIGSPAPTVVTPPPPTSTLSGQWHGPLGIYEFTQNGSSFTWRVGSEIGQGTILGDNLQVTWTGGGSATGRVVERTAQGLPAVIAWSNGVAFRRVGH
jgi:hypothetical protein